MSLLAKLAGIPGHIAARIAAAHLPSQALRFVRLALFGVIAGVAAHLTTSGAVTVPIAAVLVGALETAFRQVWPAIPIGTVIDAVKATSPAKTAPSATLSAPAAPAPSVPIPPSS
jgi:hypothetical protein